MGSIIELFTGKKACTLQVKRQENNCVGRLVLQMSKHGYGTGQIPRLQ